MPKKTLGHEEQLVGFTLKGCPEPPDLLNIMLEVIHEVGMTPDDQPVVRHFPNKKGNGGYGCQIYQVLTESWIIGGTWTKLGLTRIVLSSCKPYPEDAVETLLTKRIGPVVKKLPGGIF